MNSRFKNNRETRKYRFERRGRNILGEISRAALLVIAVFIITAAMIHGYHYVISLSYFQIRDTIVRGCRELTEKDVLTLAAIKSNQSILAVNSDAVSKRIASNPWVKNVYVGRELPNRLVIEITERTAVALVKRESGFYMLDAEGVPFKKLQNDDETDLPVLSGCFTEEKTDRNLLTRSLELLRFLSTLKDFPAINRVSEIHGHKVFGLSLFTDSGLCLQLGFDNYENKLKRLAPVMDDLDRRNLKSRFLLIDISDSAKITVQRRDALGPVAPSVPRKEFRT